MKRVLTDRLLKSLKARPQRFEIMDSVVRGMGIRVSERGVRPFILIARYPGSRNPTRRALGEYPAMSLEKAREKAGHWIGLIHRGIDPAAEEEPARLSEQRKRANTFASVAEDFILMKLSKERRGKEVERFLRREFIPILGARAISDIAPADIRSVILPIAARAPYSAHYALGSVKRLYNWAIGQHAYGIEASPCDRLPPKDIIGKREPRYRVLNDDELFACWRAASRMPYPHGPMLQMLMLTGQRHSDVSCAPWSEFNVGKREWIIAPGRFKSNTHHLVPLTDTVIALLERLPRFERSDFLFAIGGRKVHRGIDGRVKDRLDVRMERTLRALGRRRGEDPSRVKLQPFVVHDLRRSLRTYLPKLKVQSEIAEAVIGHGKRGIERHYNLYEYADEKRDALEKWATRLREITTPSPPNVRPAALVTARPTYGVLNAPASFPGG